MLVTRLVLMGRMCISLFLQLVCILQVENGEADDKKDAAPAAEAAGENQMNGPTMGGEGQGEQAKAGETPDTNNSDETVSFAAFPPTPDTLQSIGYEDSQKWKFSLFRQRCIVDKF